MNCSIARSADEVGDGWTLLVIREAFYGTRRFEDFLRQLGIARNILSDRLDRLVSCGMLDRLPDPDDGRGRLYRLTDKGREFFPVLVALMQWGDRWLSGPGKQPVLVRDPAGKPVERIAVRSAKDREELSAARVRIAPGPGANKEQLERFRQLQREGSVT